ncbi:hypothetical protein, partial [Dokdonella sp.]|uniref:hypothetical protein n=1 Tax=Dokdonella sp. TaxID=2291710 RepID=UPI001B1AA494
NDDGANIYENPEGTGWLRMNEGGFLTQVDGAFLSTIRDDNNAGNDRGRERITPIRRDIGGR